MNGDQCRICGHDHQNTIAAMACSLVRKRTPPGVHVVPIEDHIIERGLWCYQCMKSTAQRFVIAATANPAAPLRDITYCRECDAHWPSGGSP